MYTFTLSDTSLTTKIAVIDAIMTAETNHIIKSTTRGNQVWTVQINQLNQPIIVLYSIKRIGKQFAYARIEEKDTFEHTNCPRNYLKQTESTAVDHQWREKINNYLF